MLGDSFFWDNETQNFQRSYLLHLLSKSNDLKRTRCTYCSFTTHLWTPEATEVCSDHKVPLCFEVYYDWPVYPHTITILCPWLGHSKNVLLAPKFRLHIRQCHFGREVFGSLGKQLVYLGKEERVTLSTLN
jgi:hypothetical protein